MAFTHKQWGKNGRTSQLDYILGSRTQVLHIFTIKLSSTWDHYPVCAVLQEGEAGRGYEKKGRRGWEGSHATKMQARIEIKKVIQPKGDARKDCLETIQKDIEDGAKEFAHTTKLEKDRDARRVPTKIVAQERAATRSSRPVERRVLLSQARKASKQLTW